MRSIFTFKYTIKIIIRQPIDKQFKSVIMKTKKVICMKKERYFGLHFDFHAGNTAEIGTGRLAFVLFDDSGTIIDAIEYEIDRPQRKAAKVDIK